MGRASDIPGMAGGGGFEPLGHFTLPDEAWWDDFHGPMPGRLEELRGRCAADGGAPAVLGRLAREPAMHRARSENCAGEFFVARRCRARCRAAPAGPFDSRTSFVRDF